MENEIIAGICSILVLSTGGWYLYCWRHPPLGWEECILLPTDLSRYLYAGAYKILLGMKRKNQSIRRKKILDNLQKLNVGADSERLYCTCRCQMICYMTMVFWSCLLLVLLAIAADAGGNLIRNEYYITRDQPGGKEQKVKIQVDSQTHQYHRQIDLSIASRSYTVEEAQAKIQEAKTYLQKHYLGENASSQKVNSPLFLPEKIPNSLIKVRWTTDRGGYVQSDGSIHNSQIKQAVYGKIVAHLSFGELKDQIVFEMWIVPQQHTKEELFWMEWWKSLETQMNHSQTQKQITLPQENQGQRLKYKTVKTRKWPMLLFFGMLLIVSIPLLTEYQQKQRLQQREQQLSRDYPEVIERFVLLVGAGMTVKGAWHRIASDYSQRREHQKVSRGYLFEEMVQTLHEMENGKSEGEAYVAFGRRVGLLQYMKFTNVLVQNLRKGNADMLERLESEAMDAIQERRQMIRTQGEEAGTKLLLPMMIMLVIVFAMIMVAAFYSIS